MPVCNCDECRICSLGRSLPAVVYKVIRSLPFPSSHTSSSLKVAIYHFMAPVSKCCWVNAWLVSSWASLSNLLRCQAIQLNFQSVMTSLWLQCGAVVTVPSPKTLMAVTALKSSPQAGSDIIWPEDSTPSGFALPSATVPPMASTDTSLQLFWQEILQRDFFLKNMWKVFFYCRGNVLQRKWPVK